MCFRTMDISINTIFRCARPTVFENPDPDFPVSLNGSCFIVRFRKKLFAITAKHVTTDFKSNQIRVQYHPDSSTPIPFFQAYTIKGDDQDDTDQDDIIILSVDHGKLNELHFLDYPPLELPEIEKLEYFSTTSVFYIRGYPTHLRDICYENASVKMQSVTMDGTYIKKSAAKECHDLRINLAKKIDSFDGMSGGPVFQAYHYNKKYSRVGFAGMLLRGSVMSGTVRFLEHAKIVSILIKISDGDVQSSVK